jgi:hypothetical protein
LKKIPLLKKKGQTSADNWGKGDFKAEPIL